MSNGNVTSDGRTTRPYEAAPFTPVTCIYTQAQVDAMVAVERERCAKIAEDYWATEDVGPQAGEGIASRIRGGG